MSEAERRHAYNQALEDAARICELRASAHEATLSLSAHADCLELWNRVSEDKKCAAEIRAMATWRTRCPACGEVDGFVLLFSDPLCSACYRNGVRSFVERRP